MLSILNILYIKLLELQKLRKLMLYNLGEYLMIFKSNHYKFIAGYFKKLY